MGSKNQKIVLTPQQIQNIETMAGYGLTVEKIATLLGISKRTFERRMKDTPGAADALSKGRAKASLDVIQTAYEMATSGKSAAMTIFWLKVREGWKEHQIIETVTPTETKLEKKYKFKDFCENAGYPIPYPQQIEMMEFVIHGGPKRIDKPRLLLGARSYGKTVFSTICGVAYQVYCDPAFSVLLTTKVVQNGRRILKEISRCLQANGVALSVDNADEIRVKGLVGKEASVMMIPIGSSGFRSLHPKLIIFEDPVVPGSVSESDREEVKTVYNEAMKLCKNIAIIGQPVDFRDMYQYLRNIIETMEVPYGSIPELDDDLDIQRASGVDEKSIQASYFLKVDAEGDATFSGIERIDKFPIQESVGFIDPADGGDYTAFGVFTGHFQGMAIVGAAWKKRWDLCIPEIKEMCKKYQVKKLGFEVNKFGVFPLQKLREDLADIHVVVEGKYTHSNKEARIQLAAQYSKSLYLSRESNTEYVRQVIEYSHDAKYDDSPDTIATFLEWAGKIRPPRAAKKPSEDL